MANIDMGIQINNCSECKKYNKAIQIHQMFEWKRCPWLLAYDKEAQEILIREDILMHIIQMANPVQETRKIRIVGKDEFLECKQKNKQRKQVG